MSEEMKELKKKLFSTKKNGYDKMKESDQAAMDAYCADYMAYLDAGKTERLCAAETIRLAEQQGYRPYVRGMEVKAGDKLYVSNRGKAVMLAYIGSKPLSEGAQIAAAHIDSPRLDLKQHPVYEDNGACYLKTHYYGGIKKWQWVTIPLAIHGTVCKNDGTTVDICIGEDDNDPIFYITDILPHLGHEQNGRPMGSAIDGESLNVMVTASPFDDDKADQKYKLNFLAAMYEKYRYIAILKSFYR